jgi:hypothetical protein
VQFTPDALGVHPYEAYEMGTFVRSAWRSERPSIIGTCGFVNTDIAA